MGIYTVYVYLKKRIYYNYDRPTMSSMSNVVNYGSDRSTTFDYILRRTTTDNYGVQGFRIFSQILCLNDLRHVQGTVCFFCYCGLARLPDLWPPSLPFGSGGFVLVS
jgi:hypothetical protein